MSEFPSNQPESSEISQKQAQEFVDAVKRLEPLMEAASPVSTELEPAAERSPEETHAEFALDTYIVRVFAGGIDHEEINRKSWTVILDDDEGRPMYLQEQFDVSKDQSGTGLGLYYRGAVKKWDGERYTDAHPGSLQAVVDAMRAAETSESHDISESLKDLLDKFISDRVESSQMIRIADLDMNTFTPERFDRVMGLLAQCDASNLIK